MEARRPFRADHVGSLLRPPRLRDAMEGHTPDLQQIQDEEIRAAVAMQADVGLPVATDGEFRHMSWHNFVEKMDGVEVVHPAPKPGAPPGSFEPRGYAVTGKVHHTAPVEVDAFRFLASVCGTTPKVTLASPTMLLRAGREGVDPAVYPDLGEFRRDVAAAYRAELAALGAAGCRYVQIDDTNFAYICDPELRARRFGDEDPAKITADYVSLVNDAIADRPEGMTVAVHICRGNSAGAFAAQGGYEPIAEVLFTELAVDGFLLEHDDERSGDFAPLRFLPPAKRAVLGLVSTKRPEVEELEALKRRIGEAERFLPLDQLCIGPQCGFASNFKGNPVTEDIQRRKLARVVETATAVWGSAA